MNQMKSGYRKTRIDHRDYDYLKTKKLGAVSPSFPENYDVDAKLWVPDQNVGNYPTVPQLPYGCTDYTQTDLCMDEDGILLDVMRMENETHANARGGIDLREAMKAVCKVFVGHPVFFNIRPSGAIDAFDAARLAMLSTSNEKRGVSVGSPFWLQFHAVGPNGILPTPDFDLENATWHNWAVKGWKTINGVPYLICKMWLGPSYGDTGFVYMSREIFDATISYSGSCMFTIDKQLPGDPQTIDLNLIQIIVSYIRNLFNV